MKNNKRKNRLLSLSGAVRVGGYVVMVLWVAFIIAMIAWVLIASFSTTKNIFSGHLFGGGLSTKAYALIFGQYNFLAYFKNSLIYTTVVCISLILLVSPAAYALSKYRFFGKRAISLAYSAAMGLPGVMLIAPIFMAVVSMKIQTSILPLLIIYVGIGIPTTLFYLLSFFSTIPNTIRDSALVEGCSHVKAFWKVIFPLAQPGILTITIFNFIAFWNEYIWALIFARNESRRTLAIALQIVVQGMGNAGNYPGIFAAVIIVFVPTFLLFIALSNFILGDVTAGAVKG